MGSRAICDSLAVANAGGCGAELAAMSCRWAMGPSHTWLFEVFGLDLTRIPARKLAPAGRWPTGFLCELSQSFGGPKCDLDVMVLRSVASAETRANYGAASELLLAKPWVTARRRFVERNGAVPEKDDCRVPLPLFMRQAVSMLDFGLYFHSIRTLAGGWR